MLNSKLYTISPSTSLEVTPSNLPTITPSLIFLHFWGGSSRTYSQVISHLPAHHSISISFRGWGQSTGPQEPAAYSIYALASDIESLIPSLNIADFILIGHSMGGKVAQLLAGRNIFGSRLKGVVLLAPAPPTPFQLPEEMGEQQRTAFCTAESAEFVVRNVLTARPLADETVKMLVEDMVRGNRYAREAWPGYGMREDVSGDARRISVPVLVVGGERDRVETVERLECEVMGNVKGELVIVERAGHLLPVEAPEAVAGFIEGFIRKLVA
ncbi:AB hydrolase superfamily protein [Lachnellula subtilissima]|uniref:AB hydrolase superfamily protein n=1 Tax=Lachnellula subtilissima TaxID=602034 RepID=A0A8H8RKB9_9HELO|nr:AB hydrolase superfamily protein [Lachnellula subtilissima]